MDARTEAATVHIASPFGDKTRKLSPVPGANVAAIVENTAEELSWARGLVRVYCNGDEIAPQAWTEFVPGAADQVLIVPTPQYTAVYSAIQYIGSYFFGSGTVTGFLTAAAKVATVVSMGAQLVSSLFGGGSSKATYGISGASNAAMPDQVCPAVLGKRRVVPPLAATTWTETIGDDVYLRMLVQWHVDRCRVTDIRIGETPIEQYSGVEIQHRLSPTDPFPSLYNRVVREDTYDQLQLIHDNGWVERRTQVDTEEISIDLVWPAGLAWNGKDEARCDVQFRYRRANTTDWLAAPIGDGGVVRILEMKPRPFRRNFSWPAPKGEYDVGVLRVWPDAGGNYPRLQDQVFWVCMRSFGQGLPVIGSNFALSAIRIKSSNQLNGQINSLNGIVEALVPKWDGEKFGDYDVSSNPGEIINWLANGPANAKPLTDRFDVAGMGAFTELCRSKNWKCDYILDSDISVANAITLVGTAGRALGISWEDGLLSVSVDNEREAPVQVFSGRNVKNFSGKITYPDALHGVKVYFFDAASGYQQHCRTVFADGYNEANATLFERIDTPTKTDAEEAYVVGWRYLATRKLRPEMYEFDTDLEGMVVHFGSRVDIAHRRMAVGIRGARVRSRIRREDGAVTGLVLDEIVPMEAGVSYVLRAQRGSGMGLFGVVTVPGKTDTLTLKEPVPAINAPAVGNHCVFGVEGKETLPALVVGIGIGEAKSSHLTCVPYVEALIADGGAIPAWDPKTTSRAMSSPIATAYADEQTRQHVADVVIPQLINRQSEAEANIDNAQAVAQGAQASAQQAKDRNDAVLGELVEISKQIAAVAANNAIAGLSVYRDLHEIRETVSANFGDAKAYADLQIAAAAGPGSVLAGLVATIQAALDGKASTIVTDGITARVSAAEQSVKSLADRTTVIENALPQKASVTALDTLSSTVSHINDDLVAQGQSLTNLQTALDGKASTAAFNELSSKVSEIDDSLVAQGESLTTLSSTVGKYSANGYLSIVTTALPDGSSVEIGLAAVTTANTDSATAALVLTSKTGQLPRAKLIGGRIDFALPDGTIVANIDDTCTLNAMAIKTPVINGVKILSPVLTYTPKIFARNNLLGSAMFTSVTPSSNATFNAVAWSPRVSRAVIVGTNAAAWSKDGIAWTAGTVANGATLKDICWSATLNRFIAVGTYGAAQLSTEGAAFLQISAISTQYNETLSVVCDAPDLGVSCIGGQGYVYLIDGSGSVTYHSTNVANQQPTGLAWAPELKRFVMVTASMILYSSNGINWSSLVSPISNLTGVSWSPELHLFVAVSNGNGIIKSADGITWSTSETSTKGYSAVTWAASLGCWAAPDKGSSSNVRLNWSENAASWYSTSDTTNNYTPTDICWADELGLFILTVNNSASPAVLTSKSAWSVTYRTA